MKIWILPLCFLTSLCASAQQVIKEIDFLTEKFKYENIKMNQDEVLILKINNFNKRLYKIDSQISSESFNQEIPKLWETFSAIEIPTEETPSQEADSSSSEMASFLKMKSGILPDNFLESRGKYHDNLAKINNAYNALSSEISENTSVLSQYRSLLIEGQKLIWSNLEIIEFLNSCDDSFVEIQNNLLNEVDNFNQNITAEIKQKLVVSIYDPTTRKVEKSKVRQLYIQFVNVLFDLVSSKRYFLANTYSKESLAISSARVDSLMTIIQNQITVMQTDGNLGEVEEEIIVSLKSEVKKNSLKVNIDANHSFKKKLDIEGIFSSIKELKDISIHKMLYNINYVNESNFTYYSTPIEVHEDEHKLLLGITPVDSIPCVGDVRHYSFKITAKSGLKIDYSSGFVANLDFFGFENGTFRKESQVSSDSIKLQQVDNKNILFPTLAAFVHVYKRNGENIQGAVSFGLSTNEATSLNFHLGPSLILGRKQRFITSAGLTLGQISLLSEPYELNLMYAPGDLPEIIPTSKFYRLGLFISLTYNL